MFLARPLHSFLAYLCKQFDPVGFAAPDFRQPDGRDYRQVSQPPWTSLKESVYMGNDFILSGSAHFSLESFLAEGGSSPPLSKHC